MKHEFANQQRLLQKMSLTPQMRMSIQLLGMSTLDLNEYVDSAVAANPFLQKIIEKRASDRHRKGPVPRTGDEIPPEYDERTAQRENPRLAYVSQLRMMGLEERAMEIAEYLVYEMDENGYVTIDLDEAAGDLSVTLDEVQEVLETIQTLNPPGIGARDVRECLQLQLKRMGKEDSLEYEIVTDFVNELARNDAGKISKALGLNKEKVQAAVNAVKRLNPRPASSVLGKEAERVVPDMIAKVDHKKLYVEINKDWLPGLRLYNPYRDKLDIIKDLEARKFMRKNMDFARSLIDNLKRREETMCRVAHYILGYQRDAIAKEGDGMRCLTIKDVARALNFHPSTVCRAVSHKYIQINDKVMPLKGLLSHGVGKAAGEPTSATAIKKRLEALVKGEDKAHPLGDSGIKERLEKEGIFITRRTIAKYRKLLRILPAYLRRNAPPA
jgi:RNA polymerase sigma-54 factor